VESAFSALNANVYLYVPRTNPQPIRAQTLYSRADLR